jgi:diacylglycerol kinase family enzyme
MTRRYLIIRNPVSGRVGKGVTRAVAAELVRLGIATETVNTLPGSAAGQGRDGVAQGFDAVLVAGGDGTIREVAKGMLGSGVPLGVIPVGTANSLAREVNMGPAHSSGALAAVLAAARTIRVFPGIVTVDGKEEIFLEEASVGIDSMAVQRVTPRLKKWFGPLAYVLKCVEQLVRGPNCDLQVEIDGRNIPAGWFIAARAERYGGWLRLGCGVKPGDEDLVFMMIRRSPRIAFFGYLRGLLCGSFGGMAGVTLVRGKAAVIRANGNAPVQADGDLMGHSPFAIRLSEQSIELITPAPM